MKRILALILLLPLLSFAASPRTANPNSLTFIGVESGTGLSAAPYVDANGNLAVTGTVSNTGVSGTMTDWSSTITLGGSSQTLAAANATRKYLMISNPPDAASQGIATAEKLCVNFTSAASLTAAGSVCLNPGVTMVMSAVGGFVSTELVTVIGATTGHIYTAKEY